MEKFSSMGNGFTFPLQSLIFYAVCKAVADSHRSKRPIRVYGDDIVVCDKIVHDVVDLLGFYGFSCNMTKSFLSGNFRESCGSHYYRGVDVKPYYLKDRIGNWSSLVKHDNAIRLVAYRSDGELACDERYRKPYARVLREIPKALRIRIPYGFGDGGLISNLDEATPLFDRDYQRGWKFHAARDVALKRFQDHDGRLIAALFDLSTPEDVPPTSAEERYGGVDLSKKETFAVDWLPKPYRDTIDMGNYIPLNRTRIGVGQASVPTWFNLGPWV
jgi:hypothetical protein